MGFGTLFFGYFILLDLPYQTLTNIAAAALMLLGLYKLSYLNVHMRRAFIACSVFSVFALYEAVIEILDLVFFIKVGGIFLNTFSYMMRNFLIGALTLLMLYGMRDVAEEVRLNRLAKKFSIYSKITLVIYIFNLCIPPDFVKIFGETAAVIYTAYTLSVISTIATLYILIMNCLNIYSCYSQICMPESEAKSSLPPKKSKIGFVNKFREHEEEKRKEYAEYKLGKIKKRQEKRESKKK